MQKLRFLSFFLALVTILTLFSACGGGNDQEDEVEPDDYNGSIAEGEGEGEEDEPSDEYIPAEGSETAVTEIHTANDLVTKLTRKGTFILMADIDMTGVDFKPFGNYYHPFEGKFQGNGHKITGLKITAVTGETLGPAYITYKYAYSGLFGATEGAEITDLTIENADVSYSTNTEYCYAVAGIIAGYMTDTTVTDCTVSGKVYAKSKQYYSYGGAVCGILCGGKIENVDVNCEITTDDSSERSISGGITAYAYKKAALTNCRTSGTVKAVSSYGVAYSGGVIGYARSVTLTVCRSEANVYAEVQDVDSYKGTAGSATAGGIAALVTSETTTSRTKIIRCYSLNNSVTANGVKCSSYAGGIAARVMVSDITDSYSRSTIYASSENKTVYIGSAFGLLDNEYSIKGCFGYGNVHATNPDVQSVYIGGFSGYPIKPNSERLKNSAYNVNATFTLNGEVPVAIGPSALPLSSGMFTLSALKNTLQWKDTEWTQVGADLIPVI